MSNAGKNSMRWLETTSTMQAATAAEAANNIPSRCFGSSQEESKIVPLKTTSLAVAKPTTTTTTTMFDPATTAGKNSGSDSVAPLVKRITSSPGMIKTQIAKISYTYPEDRSPPHSTKKYIKPMTTMIQRIQTENPITPTTARSAQPLVTVKSNVEDYAQKKSERELEIREIQEMLEEITKNPPIFNDVTNELPTSLKETTNDTPKFNEKVTNEYTKIINEDNITSTARNSAAGVEEIANIPAQAEQPAKTTEKPVTSPTLNHIFQKSKTDLNLLPFKAATTRWRKSVREPPNEPRSKSTQPPVTKSSELLPGGSPDKKKSYNPQDARRFMEEQRKKRQKTLEYLSSHRSQQQNEKEQIKRRLEELRKYSRKVVSKNLKNAQKRTGATTMAVAGGGTGEVAVAVDEASPRKTAKLDTIVFKGAQDRNNRQNKNTTKTTKNTEPKTVAPADNLGLEIVRKSEVQKETQNKDGSKPSALMENQKRVGLLRKPEIKDHSFGAIKEFSFDKENVALDFLTPKLTTTAEQPRIKEKVVPPSTGCEMQQPTEAEPPQPQPNQSVSMSNLLLEMPEARLQRTRVVREQATQVRESSSLMLTADNVKASTLAQTPAQNERTELPYWLKPSAVQVYPYNFIMAVRRKLEAIANPPQTNTTKSSYEELSLKKAVDTPLTSMSKERTAATAQQNVKRRLMVTDIAQENHSADFATNSLDKADKRSTAKSKQNAQKSQETPPPPPLLSQTSYSDVTSNFSSISLVLPASNTCSEVSSIKSDLNVTHTKPSKGAKIVQSAEEDNTTVSSSIFNSPEKQQNVGKRFEGGEFKVPRPVSPLSLESIEHLKISSKIKETNIPKHIPHESAEVVEVDFNRLLQDFNRSLSQVIEVNEQLKSTLDKSQLLISPERKHSSNITECQQAIEDEYSTDFEGGSSANPEFEQIPTKVLKKNSFPQHRKKLFEVANIVKPLQTSSKSDTESGATSTSHRKNNTKIVQDLDINLESVGNSSAEQTTPSKNKLRSLREGSSLTSANSLDRRLQSIEHLKDNLRESILISKANRSEIKTNAERLMHNLTTSPKGEKQPLFDATTGQLSANQKQKLSHSLSNSTVDSRRVSSRRSLLLHSSSERSDIQTALSENDAASAQLSVSAQSADAATMLSASSTSSVADKSYTFDSKSNSPKAKTFNITSAKKNTELVEAEEEDETIQEELQNIVTTPQKHNNKNAPKLQQGDHKTSNSSADSSPKNSNESGATKAAYVKAHINRSRGDFMPAADDDNAVSNESHFQAAAVAAAATAAANDTITDSDSAAPPPSYKAVSAATKTVHSPPSHSNKSVASVQQKFASKSSKHARGHELITVFNQSDMELSIISSRNGSISETSLNYSSVGLYEKLIQTETTKSEHLTVLLKMREKALLDRTKGQIAWLELQKERYKAKGLLMQITAIKKKQRGILLKMEKEREEIKRLLQSTNSTTSTHSSARHHFHHSAGLQQQQQTTSPKRKRPEPRSAPPLLLPLPILPKTTRSSSISQQQKQQKITTAHSAPIIRANYELESSRTLEELLQKREADLRKRREHVERLMLWHQRLDQEEAEVQQLELMLLNYNNVHAQPLNENHLPQQRQQQQTASSDKHQPQEQLTATAKPSPHKKQGRDAKMERRLKEIDKSLRELSSISVSNNSATSTDETATSDADYVRTSGNKLNKLWRRLTTQQVERFEATRRYKLCKADLERLYEEAKLAVLRDFEQDEQRVAVELLDKTTATVLSQTSLQESPIHEAEEITNNNIVIPCLNLNFSSGQSDPEDATVQLTQEEDVTESMAEGVSSQSTLPPTTQGNTYSPCAAEEEFIRQESDSSSSSTSSNCSSHNKHAPQASAESIERRREQLLERNVQKFMELTQRFNGVQPGDGLQRSLSDTQIAENSSGVSKKCSNKAAISQRNIAYYGVKTQKRPSKGVNVEIANSLSSASSILTASSTLRSVQSFKTQTFSAEVNSNRNNFTQHSSDSKPLSANVNNIPLAVSTVATTTTPTTPVASSTIDSLDSCIIEESKASASAPIATSQTTFSATPYATTSLSNVASGSSLTQSETQAQQISEKLEEISAAVSKLTHSNSLLVRSSSSSSMKSKPVSQQQLQKEQSTKSSSTEINTDYTGHTASTSYSYSYTFDVNEPEITQSHSASDSGTIISSNSLLKTQTVPSTSLQTPPPPNDASELLSETMLLAKYNADFEDTLDETRLEDISLPQFETTNESNENDEEEQDENEHEKAQQHDQSSEVASTSPLHNLAKSTKNSSQVSASLPPPTMPPPPPPPASSSQLPSTSKEAAASVAATTNSINNNNSSSQPQLMPDIINELELRRCQQQIQQYEHVTAVPYNMYVREIPNKPPPPYVPPAHGSPMTTIFPSEERIKDLTYRRTHELYCEILKTEYTNEKGDKLPSVLAEKITNIYERIILDICREYLNENQEVLTKSDPSTFHGNLAFFNPPDRLSCLQTFVYKEVRRCLAMDKNQPKRSQVYSVYGQRAKRDHIGKIIIQEMYDEDDKWCNFHHEEAEVLDLIIEEMLTNLCGNIAKEVLLEEGGNVDEAEAAQAEEEAVEQNVTSDEIIYEDVSLIESTTSALDAVVIETETDRIEQDSINVETNAPTITT